MLNWQQRGGFTADMEHRGVVSNAQRPNPGYGICTSFVDSGSQKLMIISRWISFIWYSKNGGVCLTCSFCPAPFDLLSAFFLYNMWKASLADC